MNHTDTLVNLEEAASRTGLASCGEALLRYLRSEQPGALVQTSSGIQVDLAALATPLTAYSWTPVTVVTERGVLV